MQKLTYLLILISILTSCNSSQKVVDTETATKEAINQKVGEPLKEVETIKENIPAPAPAIIEKVEVISQDKIEEITTVKENITAPFNHDAFSAILKKNVSDQGNVNYDGIKSEWSKLRAYIASLSVTMPDDSWTQEDKLAYWMNAYNAMTIDLILRNYPLSSIKDIKDPWDQRFWKLGDKWYNLTEIEHEILRKMGDPRIHFGINCASFSCPPLLNEAFTSGKVDGQLDTLSRKFINDSKRNTITSERVDVSKIFNWFDKDFKTEGTLIDFLNTYSDITISEKAKVRYRDYDWSLNK